MADATLRRGFAFHFPALACQQHGARHLMLAAGVIRHLPPRQPERFGRIVISNDSKEVMR
jgi:hypothetical protein